MSAILLVVIGSSHAQAEPEARQLFGAMKTQSSQLADPHGSYAKGCLSGAVMLPETGPYWQAMRLSRNRNWGHPDAIDFVKKLARKAADQPGWSGLYIGDISQPRGGPMLDGHRSHQMGLDIDIWMRRATSLRLSRVARESLSSVSMRLERGAFVNKNWTDAHQAILKAAAQDPRVARIFVFPGAKVEMCKAETGKRNWLRKIRPWWGHHAHFHVRLRCPKDADNCQNQARPPQGDGCKSAQAWVDDILKPAPVDPNALKPKPRKELTLKNLPKQCAAVLSAP
ncbi:MAG: penicillin-insensitive murein endopeptidase [Paracoccaceae bacterium]|nr:penicillin-insensitive murein endopeptidase [Paracoccaceae bacterium]